MHFKPRKKPAELLFLEALHARMQLSDKDERQFFNLMKGYEGELLFDSMTSVFPPDFIILNDLLLEINYTVFQIDTLIVTTEVIYMFELKNFEGDFYYDSDKLYANGDYEVSDPLIQLRRSESLLRQLLRKLGYHIPIVASVVFINPKFTLYQAPKDIPFIFPNQVSRHLKKIAATTIVLNQRQKALADKLVDLHILNSPYKRLPLYEYNLLQKGITCKSCRSFTTLVDKSKVVCPLCQREEKVSEAVLRSANEFKFLFPNRKMTTNIIWDWCQIISSKRRIRSVLKKNFESVGAHRWIYYR